MSIFRAILLLLCALVTFQTGAAPPKAFTEIVFIAPDKEIGYANDLSQILEEKLQAKKIGYLFVPSLEPEKVITNLRESTLFIVWPRSSEQIEELSESAAKLGRTLVFISLLLPLRANNELDNVWSVSCSDGMLARKRNELILDYLLTHPDYDRNRNGKLDFIMLRGIEDNPEEAVRSRMLFNMLNRKGVPYNVVDDYEAQWRFRQSYDHLQELLETGALNADDVEMIIANSDDMALGALGALTAYRPGGWLPPAFGIDGIAQSSMSIRDGVMQSVKMDLKETVNAILGIFAGRRPEEIRSNMSLTVEGRRILVPSFALTQDSIKKQQFMN